MPPDANTLLSVAEHCLRSRNYVNVIVAGKQPGPQWLGMDAAVRHCAAGAGLWDWASNDGGAAPDVVMACAGDVPTLETLAAVDLLRRHAPEMKVRMVNAVDLMALQPPYEWIAGQLPPRLAAGRTVAVHLGSGASLCALQAGASIETTMGMTPLDGLMMGTRCGSLDPGVVLYLMQARGMGVAMWSTCFTTNPGCWAWPA